MKSLKCPVGITTSTFRATSWSKLQFSAKRELDVHATSAPVVLPQGTRKGVSGCAFPTLHPPALPGSGAPCPAALQAASAPSRRSPGPSAAASGVSRAAPRSGTRCAAGGTAGPALEAGRGLSAAAALHTGPGADASP